MRIVTNNLALNSTITATSQDPNFPLSNLTHPHRAKRWRSYRSYTPAPIDYVVTSNNNQIYFMFAGSSVLNTISIQTGSYYQFELLEQLTYQFNNYNLLNSTNFVVTYDAILHKWTITNSTAFTFCTLKYFDYNLLTGLLGFSALHYYSPDVDTDNIIVIPSTTTISVTNQSSVVFTATISAGTYSPLSFSSTQLNKLFAATGNKFSVGIYFDYATGGFYYEAFSWTTTDSFTITSSLLTSICKFSVGTLVTGQFVPFYSPDILVDTSSVTYITVTSAANTAPNSAVTSPFIAQRIVLDLGSAQAIDTAALFWPKENLELTSSAVVQLQANNSNSWTSPAVNITLTVDQLKNRAINYFSSDQIYQFWSVLITDSANTNNFVELSNIILGKALSVQNLNNGFTYNTTDQSVIQKSQAGYLYADKYQQMDSATINFQTISQSDIQILHNAFKFVGNTQPIFVALNGLDATGDDFAMYCRISSIFPYQHVIYKIFNLSLDLEECF
jgi:hypothetical protein